MDDAFSHQLSMTILMTPDMANFSGNVHGGTILKYLDQVAYACASRYAGQYVVTLSVDQVVFREPIHVGELVTFLAAVNYTGRTSMEIGIKVVTEDIRKKLVRHTNSCYFTMVARTTTAPPPRCRRWRRATSRKSSASRPPACAANCARKWNGATTRSSAKPRMKDREPPRRARFAR